MGKSRSLASTLLWVTTLTLACSTASKAPRSSVLGGTEASASARSPAALAGVHRIVFLGDSITQAGDYVVDFDCWQLAHGLRLEVLNLGLASETATELTPDENAPHLMQFGFGRPCVSERLARALAATKPDLVFASYGMNDGGSLPPDESGTQRFASAITRLREATLAAGVKRVVICTPPVQDDRGNDQQKSHDENLARYTAWLLSKRAEGWEVVDIHTPMRQALDAGRTRNPAFEFAPDGVHPGREGHWLMARQILNQSFGAKLDGVATAEDLFPAHGVEIRELVHRRMALLFDAWMTQIGHTRPGVAGGPGVKPGLPLAQADAQAAEIGRSIEAEMASPQ